MQCHIVQPVAWSLYCLIKSHNFQNVDSAFKIWVSSNTSCHGKWWGGDALINRSTGNPTHIFGAVTHLLCFFAFSLIVALRRNQPTFTCHLFFEVFRQLTAVGIFLAAVMSVFEPFLPAVVELSVISTMPWLTHSLLLFPYLYPPLPSYSPSFSLFFHGSIWLCVCGYVHAHSHWSLYNPSSVFLFVDFCAPFL